MSLGARILLAPMEGLLDHTLLVFTSDHGEWLGDHGLMLKGPMHYEGVLRVGLLVQGPGVPAGRYGELLDTARPR